MEFGKPGEHLEEVRLVFEVRQREIAHTREKRDDPMRRSSEETGRGVVGGRYDEAREAGGVRGHELAPAFAIAPVPTCSAFTFSISCTSSHSSRSSCPRGVLWNTSR